MVCPPFPQAANVKIKNMKKNDEMILTCTDLSDLGFGIAHKDGMTIFVSNLLPGEEARVRLIRVQKNWAIGKVMERLSTSNERVEPACDKADRCGGCSLMHLSAEAQKKYKEKQLRDLFRQVRPDIEVQPLLTMESPWHYRNKAQFPVGVQNGKIIGGFYRPKSNTIVPVRDCLIQSEAINDVYRWLLDHLSVKQAEALRHLLIRHSAATGETQVVFIGSDNVDLQPLTEKLVQAFPDIKSVVFNRNTRNDNVILGDAYEVLYGSDSIREKCLDLEIKLHFKSFFQVNPSQMEVLYSKALELAELDPHDRVIELYSGTGTIGLLAAGKAGHVTGVEIVPEAVENAKENQKRNGIENAEFICMDATRFAAENKQPADVVLVDPPRKGMTRQGIEDITRLDPRRIIYISCNPRTLARDLKEFDARGYTPKRVQPVDMFCHTSGVECIARLERREDKKPQ